MPGQFGWLVVFNIPSTARSFTNGTPFYCRLRFFTLFPLGIEPRLPLAIAWQSITQPLHHTTGQLSWRLIYLVVMNHALRLNLCEHLLVYGHSWV